MRQAIDTAPRDGKDVILEDERSGTYDVAHWSPQAGQWLLDNGESIKITPTHWHPMPGATSSSSVDEESEALPPRRRSEWPLRYSLFVLAAPVLVGLSFCGIGEVVKTSSVDVKRQATDRVAASKGQDSKGPESKPAAPASEPSSDAAREDLNRIVAQLRRALDEERGRSVELAARLARAQRQIETQAAQLQQASERAGLADPPEGAKSTPALEQEQMKSAALEQQISAQREEIATIRLQHGRELSDAQDALDRLHAEMRAEAMKQEGLLAQAREQSGVLTQEIGAKRDELASTAERNRQELEAERGRSAGVVAALATARREIEAQAARLREANERAGGLEQAQAAVSALQEELRKQVALVAGAAAARDELAASTAQQGKELAGAREAMKKLEAQRQTDIATSAELLEQERDLTATLRQQVGAVREELTAREARGRRALEEERARSAGIAEQLAAAHREIEVAKRQSASGQEAIATPAAATARLLEERDKAAALAREAVAARDELAAGVAQQARELAAAREAIERLEAQRQADIATYAGLLEQERGQSASLTQQVGAVREEVSAREIRDRRALEEERARIVALVEQLAAAQQELDAAQRQRPGQLEAIAVAARSLDEEREKTVALSREADAARTELAASAAQHRDELVAARRAVERLEARLKEDAAAHAQLLDQERGQTAAVRDERSAGEARHQRALDVERARGAAVAEQLAEAIRQLEARAAELREAKAESVRLREAAGRPAAGPPASPEGERLAARTVGTSASAGIRALSEPAREDAAAGTAVAAAPVQPGPEATRLIARASVLLGQGDVGSARIVLERAAQMGIAQASFMLAETYDSNVLSAWGTYGTRGDAARARQLYAHALAGGVQEARDRLNTLGP